MKTMNSKEVKHMIRVLPQFLQHYDTYIDCTIAKIFGIYQISIDSFEPIFVMIMQNSMPNVPDSELQFVFDMKGSSINREVLKNKSNQQLLIDGPTGGKVLKDLDYLRLKEIYHFFEIEDKVV
jgi:hypothetical protein